MVYLYYLQRKPQKMTKADSESKKIYSNKHPKDKTPTDGSRVIPYGKTEKVKVERLFRSSTPLPRANIYSKENSKNKSSERNKPYVDIDTAVKDKMKETTPKTFDLLKGLSPVTQLRKRIYKKNILKQLKDRPENLSPAKIKID